jgi:hypothetical protein
MGDNFREACWFAFSLVLAYYTISAINCFWEIGITLLKISIANSVLQ